MVGLVVGSVLWSFVGSVSVGSVGRFGRPSSGSVAVRFRVRPVGSGPVRFGSGAVGRSGPGCGSGQSPFHPKGLVGLSGPVF